MCLIFFDPDFTCGHGCFLHHVLPETCKKALWSSEVPIPAADFPIILRIVFPLSCSKSIEFPKGSISIKSISEIVPVKAGTLMAPEFRRAITEIPLFVANWKRRKINL